jgi:MFS family permease
MRELRIVVLALWIGAIVYFAFAVAPSVFGVLTPRIGGRTMAGDIVNRALMLLHYFGIACALIFLVTGLRRLADPANALVFAMLVLTLISQFGISRKMHQIRTQVMLDELDVNDPMRRDFNSLHKLSTATEGAVLLLGIGALVIEGRGERRRRD